MRIGWDKTQFWAEPLIGRDEGQLVPRELEPSKDKSGEWLLGTKLRPDPLFLLMGETHA